MESYGYLAGKTVLVVENEWLIADDLRRSLANEGAQVLGPVPSVGQAMTLIYGTPQIDAAVLDVHLEGGSNVYLVAEMLRARNVPFMFATGYDDYAIRRDFAKVPHLMKPFLPGSVARMLAATSSLTQSREPGPTRA